MFGLSAANGDGAHRTDASKDEPATAADKNDDMEVGDATTVGLPLPSSICLGYGKGIFSVLYPLAERNWAKPGWARGLRPKTAFIHQYFKTDSVL